MKLTIGKQRFGRAIRAAHAFSDSAEARQKFNEGGDVKPFRYPVTLLATPIGLEVSAGDGGAVLTQRIPAGVAETGSVSLDTQALRSALVRPKARDIVTFEAHGDAPEAAMAACHLLDTDQVTALEPVPIASHDSPTVQLGEHLETLPAVPAAELAAIIAETAFAASADPLRPYLNGLFIESRDGRLRTVATDGSRLAIRDTNIPLAAFALPADGFTGPGAILPLKPARALQHILKAGGCTAVELWTGGARFRCDAGDVATQFADWIFPLYRRVIPEGRMKSAPIDLFMLADAVKAASSGPRSRGRWPKVTLNGRVTLTARSASGRHDGEEKLLPLTCPIEGDAIAFNGWDLEDAGRAFGRVRTAIRYTTSEHPAMFVSPDRPELVIVQMPRPA